MKRQRIDIFDIILMTFTLLSFTAIVLMTAAQSLDPLFNVVLGLSPTAIYLIINYAHLRAGHVAMTVFLVPAFLCILFLVFGLSGVFPNSFDVGTLTAINVILCAFYSIFFAIIGYRKREHPHL